MSHAVVPLRPRRASSIALFTLLAAACSDDETGSVTRPVQPAPGDPVPAATVQRPSGWTEATHGNDAAPNYDLLFDAERVHRIDIRIDPESYALMQSDLDELLGEFPGPPMDPFCTEAASAVTCTLPDFFGGGEGTCGQFGQNWVCLPNGGPGGPGAPGAPPGDPGASAPPGADAGPPAGDEPDAGAPGPADLDAADAGAPPAPPGGGAGAPPPGGGPGGGPGGPPGAGPGGPPTSGALDLLSRDPIYVPVEVQYEGNVWTQVAMRYKGNSSLAASGGSGKLPFRLNFDRYEAEHPEIDDQRFHGFEELTFSSNWNDNSQLRELYATEVLRDRGIPAARAAFYRVYVDVGAGPEYWGLYTMIEDPSDAMMEAQFGSSDGNLYKPDGPGADWVAFDQRGFVKKNNEDAADWSDVQAAIAALHAPSTDAAAWRAALEATFDVDGFLAWWAVNTVIVNWDTYGALAHNYYLYGDPARGGQLRWIPWDHNLSMAEGGLFGMGTNQPPEVEIFHTEMGEEWPLVTKLLADPTYRARYRDGLAHALEGLFSPEQGTDRLRELHTLIQPYVTGPDGERPTHRTIASPEAFADSIDGPQGLADHLLRRHDLVTSVLSQQP